jgi:hypothetical protein
MLSQSCRRLIKLEPDGGADPTGAAVKAISDALRNE